MHKKWCGASCADCANPCETDEQLYCSPDCEYLGKNGEMEAPECLECDAYKAAKEDSLKSKFRAVWKSTEIDKKIGHSMFCLEDSEGNVVEGSEVSLIDYTCQWQKENHRSRDINNSDAFYWQHTWGSSTSKLYTEKDNKSLEDVKKEIENFVFNLYIRVYNNAIKRAEEYEKLAKWCSENTILVGFSELQKYNN